MSKTRYILRGNSFAGGSDIFGDGRKFEKEERSFYAEDDEEARAVAKREYPSINDKELFKQIYIS